MRPSRPTPAAGAALAAVALTAATLLAPTSVASDTSTSSAIRLVGSRRVELTDVQILTMSPDGSSIAGVRSASDDRAGDELCTFDIETLDQRACTSVAGLGSPLRLEDVTWSPDGSMLAFTAHAFRTLMDGDLWLMDAMTGQVSNLDDDGFVGEIPFLGDTTDGLVTVDVSPAFTPDGGSVTFSRSTFEGTTRLGNDIATVSVEGGTPTRLTTVSDQVGVAYFGMAWAPDGSMLAYSYASVDPDDRRNGIWVVAADGSRQRPLAGATDPRLGAPAVARMSPLGDRLLAWYPVATGRQEGADTLALVDIDSGSVTPLRVDGDGPPIGAIQMAAFSPDGTTLLEVTSRTDRAHQVWVRDLATGSVASPLVDGLDAAGSPAAGMMPTWATNGTALVTDGGDLSGATLLTLEGGLPTPTG